VQPFEFFALEVRSRFGRRMLVNLADTHGPLRCAQVLFGAVLRGFETEFYSLKADVEKLILQIKKQMSLKVRGRRWSSRGSPVPRWQEATCGWVPSLWPPIS